MAKRKGGSKKKSVRYRDMTSSNRHDARVVTRLTRQTGKSNVSIDRKLTAKPPGQRQSADGGRYWETRKNRSDLRNKV